MSLYDSYDAHNQYYIDRVYFNFTYIATYSEYHGYNETLLEIRNNEYFLGELETKSINKKMCEIALSKNANVINFVPKELLGELYVRFNIRSKNSIRKKNYNIILDTILGEIEAGGLSLHETDFWASKKRKPPAIEWLNDFNSIKFWYKNIYGNYKEHCDRDEYRFNLINNRSKFFRGMLYGEVLANINKDGLLLKYMPEDSRDIKMCQIAMIQNQDAEEYIPRYLMIIIDSINAERRSKMGRRK